MGGNSSQPPPSKILKDAKVIIFSSKELCLNFEKNAFVNEKMPDSIEVYFVLDKENKFLDYTKSNIFEYQFDSKMSKYIEETHRANFAIGIICVNHLNKKSTMYRQTVRCRPKPIFLDYGLSFKPNEIKNQIQFQLQKIKNIPNENEKLVHLNIMLFGCTKSGKSSLINTFDYCLNGNLSAKAYVSCGDNKTGTKMFQRKKLLPWLSLWDSPGFQSDDILEGENRNIQIFWKQKTIMQVCLNPSLEIKEDKEVNQSEKSFQDQIHSTIFVWGYDQSDKEKKFAIEKFRQGIEELNSLDPSIQIIFALTKLDRYISEKNMKIDFHHIDYLYDEFIENFKKNIDSSNISLAIRNYGESETNYAYDDGFKLIALFILYQAIKNGLERLKLL